MKTITIEQAVELQKKWQKRLIDKNTMRTVTYEDLKKDGFEHCILGTGKSAYICSTNVKIMTINSRYYLNGVYLVIGTSNRSFGRGVRYNGWCLKIN